MNKTPELLPCPFCGKDDELRITHIYEGEDYIGCDRCKYDGVHIMVWNTRVYPPEVQKAIEKQKPKAPIIRASRYQQNYYCPNCDNDVSITFDHCSACGQRLGWSEE